jgi:3-oxoacyl-[acyl-carrier protein] reductase
MGRLTGKSALVTGSSRGIGAAIARQLAREGAAVVIHFGHDEDAARTQQREIRAEGGIADIAGADLGSVSGPVELVRRAIEIRGGLDLLINNAGVFANGMLETITEAQVEQLFNVNVRAVLLATKTFAQETRSLAGRVINISSIAARFPAPGVSLYAATKAAVEALTRSHAIELGARGITVNAIAPGTTETEMSAAFSEELRSAIARGTALQRLGTPSDIAMVATFLCSDEAAWISGQIIGADGGMISSAGNIARVSGVSLRRP